MNRRGGMSMSAIDAILRSNHAIVAIPKAGPTSSGSGHKYGFSAVRGAKSARGFASSPGSRVASTAVAAMTLAWCTIPLCAIPLLPCTINCQDVALRPDGIGGVQGAGAAVDVVEDGVAVDQDGAILPHHGRRAGERVDGAQAPGIGEGRPGQVAEGDAGMGERDAGAADEGGVVLADQVERAGVDVGGGIVRKCD